MRALITLALFAFSLMISLLTFEVVGTAMSAMITGAVTYACLELITITLRV